jgi:nucleoside-diphosphate-sugar epimerase
MRVAITGGSGQLGTQVIRRLLDDGEIEAIVSIDKRPPRLGDRKLRHVEADIRDADLASLFAGCEVVFHFAFIVTGLAPREVFWGVNVGGTKRVFEAAAKAGVKQVVYSSSVAAYGCVPGHPIPIVEDTLRRHQPDFPYSATKFEVEAFLDDFEKAHPELCIVRMRPVILIGPRMEHPLGEALPRRILPAVTTKVMPIVWDEDVADFAILAMKKKARGPFNLSADDLRSASELAKATGIRSLSVPRPLARLAARLSPNVDPAWLDIQDVTLIASSDKAKALGWSPRCPTAVSVIQRFLDVVPKKTLFGRLKRAFRHHHHA